MSCTRRSPSSGRARRGSAGSPARAARYSPREPIGRKRGRSSGTFTRANRSSPGLGVADEEPEAQRQPRDVRERLAAGRRQAASAPGRSRASKTSSSSLQLLPARGPRSRRRRSPACESGLELALPELRLLAREPRASRSRISRSASWGVQPVGRAHGDARGRLIHQAGHPDHEELVQVRREDRAEVDPLEQREAGSSRRPRGPAR